MLKGGYKIIDLKNIELTDDAFLFEGLYNKLLNNYGKTIMLSNINIDFNDFKDYFVQPVIIDGNIECTIGQDKIIVTPDDYVYIESGIIGGGGSDIESYEDLSDLPYINGVEVIGSKSLDAYGIPNAGLRGITVSNGKIISSPLTIGAKVIADGFAWQSLQQLNVGNTLDLVYENAMASAEDINNFIPSNVDAGAYSLDFPVVFIIQKSQGGGYELMGQAYIPIHLSGNGRNNTGTVYSNGIPIIIDTNSYPGAGDGWIGLAWVTFNIMYNSNDSDWTTINQFTITRIS